MCLWLSFDVCSPTRIYLYSFLFIYLFILILGLGFDPFNDGFYLIKFDFPFNSSCKYSDFMFLSKDK